MLRYYFVDLDDTLFHTESKLPEGPRFVAAHAPDGRELSFMTSVQKHLFDFLLDTGKVIPTTGRNVAAFRRVSLPFNDWAICSFGGIILDSEGKPDQHWASHIRSGMEAFEHLFDELLRQSKALAERLDVDVRIRVIGEAELPHLYISIKHNAENGPDLARYARALRPLVPSDWTLHLNDHNCALLPPFLGKDQAVVYLRSKIEQPHVAIGIGDSHTDAPFLSRCDFAMMPVSSQLFARAHGGEDGAHEGPEG